MLKLILKLFTANSQISEVTTTTTKKPVTTSRPTTVKPTPTWRPTTTTARPFTTWRPTTTVSHNIVNFKNFNFKVLILFYVFIKDSKI
jgi:hypothetical protein